MTVEIGVVGKVGLVVQVVGNAGVLLLRQRAVLVRHQDGLEFQNLFS